jgi:hypothetical protein
VPQNDPLNRQARCSRKPSQFVCFKCNTKARCRALWRRPPAVERDRVLRSTSESVRLASGVQFLLDAHSPFDGAEYRRVITQVRTSDGDVLAWIYVLAEESTVDE